MSKTCLVSQYIPSLGSVSTRSLPPAATRSDDTDSLFGLVTTPPLKVRGGGSGSLNRFGLHRQRDTRPTGDSDDCDLGPECTKGSRTCVDGGDKELLSTRCVSLLLAW